MGDPPTSRLRRTNCSTSRPPELSAKAGAQALAGLISSAAGPAAAPAQFALGVESSFSGRSWRMREVDQDLARELQLAGCAAPLARLLATRGIAPGDAAGYLDPKLKHLLPDPDSFAHMTAAAVRFARAIRQQETIAVLADYDVDGACSAASIVGWLKSIGRTALLHVPDRLTEGYGPSAAAVKLLRGRGASLLVTLDCGAAAHAPLAAAAASGLDVIVLDHHAVDANPPVLAHVNPNGPDDRSGHRNVCAAGLTFLFLIAVQRQLRVEGWFSQTAEPDLLEQLDLVALATVADVVPLTGLNRAFVRQGLRRTDRLRRPGLAALARLANANAPFSVYHLGFAFGPRINAGGRVGRCDLGARLLASIDAQEADVLAAELDRHNRERQAIEAGILRTASELAGQQRENPFLLIGGDGWHPGVVGIIAGRLKDRHAKPALVAGFTDADADADPIGRGSARSVANVDLGAVIRAAHAEGILDTGGGHAMAAGFSIRRSRMPEFAAFLSLRITSTAATNLLRDWIIDAVLSPSAATPSFADEVERAGPYGAGNPEPVFMMPDMLVVFAGVVADSHVRLRAVGRDGQGISGIAFRAAASELGTALLNGRGRRMHLLGRLKRDDYDGVPKVQLHIEDAAPAEA